MLFLAKHLKLWALNDRFSKPSYAMKNHLEVTNIRKKESMGNDTFSIP